MHIHICEYMYICTCVYVREGRLVEYLKGPGRRVSARCIDARRSGLREMTQSPSRYITQSARPLSLPFPQPPSPLSPSPSFRQLSCVPPLWRSLPSGAGLSAARLRLRLVPRGAHKFNAKVKAATTRSRSRVGRKRARYSSVLEEEKQLVRSLANSRVCVSLYANSSLSGRRDGESKTRRVRSFRLSFVVSLSPFRAQPSLSFSLYLFPSVLSTRKEEVVTCRVWRSSEFRILRDIKVPVISLAEFANSARTCVTLFTFDGRTFWRRDTASAVLREFFFFSRNSATRIIQAQCQIAELSRERKRISLSLSSSVPDYDADVARRQRKKDARGRRRKDEKGEEEEKEEERRGEERTIASARQRECRFVVPWIFVRAEKSRQGRTRRAGESNPW